MGRLEKIIGKIKKGGVKSLTKKELIALIKIRKKQQRKRIRRLFRKR